MTDSVLYEVSTAHSVFETIILHILSVRYYDIPIIIHLSFLVSWYYLYFKVRGISTILTLQFLISMIGISYTEDINTFFSHNWKRFYYSKNYFDDACIFILVFWFLPLGLISVLIAIQFLLDFCKTVSIHRYFHSVLVGH